MFNTETLIQFAADAFRSVVAHHEFHLNLCRTVLRMVEQGRLALNLQAAPYFTIEVDEKALCTPTAPRCLPSALELMSEHKKARLRASYARAKQIYRPNAAHLSLEQRTGEPVKLSGPNATTNVALWPTAMQVNLGHDYKDGEYSTPLSNGDSASYTNSKSDVTVQGAIDVLNALVQGLDEKWLETPGTIKQSRMLDTHAMTSSYTQEKKQAFSTSPKSRLTRSYGQIGFPTASQGSHQHSLALREARSDEYLEFSPRRRSGIPKASRAPHPYAQSNPSTENYQPAPSWWETYDAELHNKDRLSATFERLRSDRSCSDSKPTLHGPDGELNVALYPRASLDRLDLDEEDKLKAKKANVRDPTATIGGAIDRLNALIQGVGYNWINTSQPANLPAKSVITLPPQSIDSRIPPRLIRPDTARMIQSYARSSNSSQPVPSQNEVYGSSTHNKDRLRATFERTQTIYRPGSCMRLAGQHDSSYPKPALHGTDGALNIALYPRAMLVRLNVDEEDDTGAANSVIQDATGTVEGAIDRLNSLVKGAAYEWLGIELPEDIRSEYPATRPMRSTCSTMSSRSSRSSITSGTSTSSLSQLVTPLDSTFPLGITHGSRKF